ncbi:MAG: nucleotidyl transferase AbiEii/AbiGii toxin family protein [Acidobacteriota bacterium]|nr:nucleotidyl transferase AbiEii/AbiGii toxin family protein [Acidobacteriota bacterium]
MTSSFAQPLEIKHSAIDPILLGVIRRIDESARRCGTRYFLAGATAREIMLRHVFGQAAGRRTFDVDFGIAVETWTEFESLKSALIAQANFIPHEKQKQRLFDAVNRVIVDLIPFGGIEHDGNIFWPPEEDIIMRVTGFQDALAGAVPVRLASDLVVPVVSLPLLLVLKLFAWKDRKSEKRDAADIYTLLRQYGEAGNEDRLYGEHIGILEAQEFNLESAGAVLIAVDAKNLVSATTREQLNEILNSDDQMSELTDQMITTSSILDRSTGPQCELLIGKLRHGFFASEA